MKYLFLFCSFLLPSLLGAARSEVVFSRLQSFYSNAGMLSIDKVVLSDTATVMYFTARGKINDSFQFSPDTYLSDEKSGHYPLKGASGLEVGKFSLIPRSGQMKFQLVFAPLPRETQIFDLIEGTDPGMFRILGIRDETSELRIPVAEEAIDKAETADALFRDGTARVSGRIEDCAGDGKQHLLFFYYTRYGGNMAQTFEEGTRCVALRSDGTFEAELPLSHPVWGEMALDDGPVKVPFYVRPGDRLLLTVRGTRKNALEVDYKSSHSRGALERLMKHQDVPIVYPSLDELTRQGKNMEGEAFVKAVEESLAGNLRVCDYVVWKYGLSPFEAHLLKNRCRLLVVNHALFTANFWYNRKVVTRTGPDVRKEDYVGYDYSAFRSLSLLRLDDPSLSFLPSCYGYPSALQEIAPMGNAYSYAYYASSPVTGSEAELKWELLRDSLQLDILRSLAGVEGTPWALQAFLVERVCRLPRGFTPELREKVVDRLSACLTYPFFKRKIRELNVEAQRNVSWAYELPEGDGREEMKGIVDKYKGRYVQVVFLSSYNEDLSFAMDPNVRNLMLSEVGDDGRDLQIVAVLNQDAYPDEDCLNQVKRELHAPALVEMSGDRFLHLQELFRFAFSPKQVTFDRSGLVLKQSLDMKNETMFRSTLRRMIEADGKLK